MVNVLLYSFSLLLIPPQENQSQIVIMSVGIYYEENIHFHKCLNYVKLKSFQDGFCCHAEHDCFKNSSNFEGMIIINISYLLDIKRVHYKVVFRW